MIHISSLENTAAFFPSYDTDKSDVACVIPQPHVLNSKHLLNMHYVSGSVLFTWNGMGGMGILHLLRSRIGILDGAEFLVDEGCLGTHSWINEMLN